MAVLRISLFGCVRIDHQELHSSQAHLTKTIQELLVFLLLQKHRMHSREVLASLFWGDYPQERARGCLNTALWRLRRALEPEGVPDGTYLLSNHHGEVGFNNKSARWVDMEIFQDASQALLAREVEKARPEDVMRMEEAIPLYTGDLLEGFFEDWAIRQREYVRQTFINDLTYLMRYFQVHADPEKGLYYARRILDLDPLREEIHRQVMHFHLARGERSLAVRQYATCQELMRRELGIPLMEETEQLYQQVLSGSDPRPLPAARMDMAGVLAEMERLEDALDTVYHQFIRLLQRMDQM